MIENSNTFTYLGYIVNNPSEPNLPALLFKEGIYLQADHNPDDKGWHPFYSEAFIHGEIDEDCFNRLPTFENDPHIFLSYYYNALKENSLHLNQESRAFFFYDPIQNEFYAYPSPLKLPDGNFNEQYAKGILANGEKAASCHTDEYLQDLKETNNGNETLENYQSKIGALIDSNDLKASSVQKLMGLAMKKGSLQRDAPAIAGGSVTLFKDIEEEMKRIKTGELTIATAIVNTEAVNLKLTKGFKDFKYLDDLDAFVNAYLKATGQSDFINNDLFSHKDFATGKYAVTMECVYTMDRELSQGSLGIHKDSDGQLLFVSLILNNNKPTPATEWTWDLNDPSNLKAAAYDAVWPPFLKATVLGGKKELKAKYDKAPMTIEGGLFEPYAYQTWVDEFVWHATPLIGNRIKKDARSIQDLYRAYYGKDESFYKSNVDFIPGIIATLSYLGSNPNTTVAIWLKSNRYAVPLQLSFSSSFDFFFKIFSEKALSLNDLLADVEKMNWDNYKTTELSDEMSQAPGDQFKTPAPIKVVADSSTAKLQRTNSDPNIQTQLAQSVTKRNFMRLWVKVVPFEVACNYLRTND